MLPPATVTERVVPFCSFTTSQKVTFQNLHPFSSSLVERAANLYLNCWNQHSGSWRHVPLALSYSTILNQLKKEIFFIFSIFVICSSLLLNITFTFSHLQTLLSKSDLQLANTKVINLEEENRQRKFFMRDKFSVVAWRLTGIQHSGWGWNGEQECSGEWFWASLWWYHEASLTSRSQTSGGDVDL